MKSLLTACVSMLLLLASCKKDVKEENVEPVNSDDPYVSYEVDGRLYKSQKGDKMRFVIGDGMWYFTSYSLNWFRGENVGAYFDFTDSIDIKEGGIYNSKFDGGSMVDWYIPPHTGTWWDNFSSFTIAINKIERGDSTIKSVSGTFSGQLWSSGDNDYIKINNGKFEKIEAFDIR